MKSSNKYPKSSKNVMDAIKTLSAIADFDSETTLSDVFDDTETAEQSNSPPPIQHTIQWLKESKNGDQYLKKTFGVILAYLRDFYKSEHHYITDPETLEGINAMMTLAGEAAKKIDAYRSDHERESVTQSKEYKQLNEFYRTRIIHQIDEGVLSKWILALSINQKNEAENDKKLKFRAKSIEEGPKHIFVNLDAVKNDTEYELFFIRKEDGSHFFSPRLIKNIQLICDFSGGESSKDSLIDMPIWLDEQFQQAAENIIKATHEQIEQFYHLAFKFRHRDFVALLHKSLMALLLASKPGNLRERSSEGSDKRKNCGEYFQDFQLFLREALHSDDYRKLVASLSNERKQNLNSLLIELVNSLCHALYLNIDRFKNFEGILHELFRLANHQPDSSIAISSKNQLCEEIKKDYMAMQKLLKAHSRGPLMKLLEALEGGYRHGYDPFSQLNLPSELYAFALEGNKIVNLHLPSPTKQEYIHRASLLDEFQAFLRYCQSEFPPHKHLLINLQDRTSWREHARAAALEDLRAHEDIQKAVVVVTLAKETDFYHQLPPYQNQNHAHQFLKHYKMHLGDETSGYYFPSNLKSLIMNEFANGVMEGIHRVFFEGKNTLSHDERLSFIDIFDTLLVLRLIDLVRPDTFSLTCKDGIDISTTCNCLLFIFLSFLYGLPFDEHAKEELNKVLYAPTLLIRERLIQHEDFDRMCRAIRTIEHLYHELGADGFSKKMKEVFGRYFSTSFGNRKLLLAA